MASQVRPEESGSSQTDVRWVALVRVADKARLTEVVRAAGRGWRLSAQWCTGSYTTSQHLNLTLRTKVALTREGSDRMFHLKPLL